MVSAAYGFSYYFTCKSVWNLSEWGSTLSGGFSVFAGVGERTREGNDLYREMIESGVIKLGEKQVSVLFSQN